MINRTHSKMDKIVPPVVTAKNVRGREMISKTVPTDIFEGTKPDIEKPREGNAEVFHEGYVDGKRYLVPDSNLEAMKDIVNFKMRPRRSVKYKHQTSYELSEHDHFRKKLSHLLDKLDKMPSEDPGHSLSEEKENVEEEEMVEEEESTDEEEEEQEEQRLKRDQSAGESEEDEEQEESFPEEEPIKREQFEPIEGGPEEESDHEHETEPKEAAKSTYPNKSYVDIQEGTDTGTIVESETETETETSVDSDVEHETKPNEAPKSDSLKNKYVDIKEGTETKNNVGSEHKPHVESDRSYIRLLISGHFKKGDRPIYIIQEYNGGSLFKDRNTDIFTSEKNGDIDVLIAGKYYNENILEETNGKPIALDIKPDKILIDENRSKVYEDYFEDVFNMKTADILVTGQFITNETTKKVTPFIRFGIKRKYP